ncbi:unnamed protein product [Closterium sp. NIES-53]
MASGEGDEVAGGRACYFHRDLKRGSYGGDVSCLQEYLRTEGLLYEEPSGYFGTATEEAVIKWQTSNALVPARGIVGYSSRVAYARKHGLPTTEQLRAMEKAAEVRPPHTRCCALLRRAMPCCAVACCPMPCRPMPCFCDP